jgi:glycine C-acetyltransferase
MDGYHRELPEICDLADQYGATGHGRRLRTPPASWPERRGTPGAPRVMRGVDILTGTLGKALGGAAGGYVAGRNR